METLKKICSLVLCFAVLMTMVCTAPVTASAASKVSTSIGWNTPENSGDYAYWNGSKVMKSKTTVTNEIKWMQVALNRCITHEGLKATKLTIDGSFGPATKAATIKFQKAAGLTADGSFGPATIKKMKSVLDDGKVTFKKASSSSNAKGFEKQNILQVNANSSSKYISGSWYKLSNGNCGCCEEKYSSEYGEHEYIQGGGCGVVALVSAIYNLGGTIDKKNVGNAVDKVFDWAYSKKYWKNGVKNRAMFANSDDKFGSTYGFKISSQYTGTSTDKTLKNHIKSGGTAVVHVHSHFMTVVDYRTHNGVEQYLVYDPAPGSGTKWNSKNRENLTSPQGTWISLADLKNDGGKKGSSVLKENIEIDFYWLVSAK